MPKALKNVKNSVLKFPDIKQSGNVFVKGDFGVSRPSDDQSQEFFATAFKLESTVQYQDRSIVSREILNKKAGTLTLFAFDKGQGLSEHTAPYDATILILDGKAEIIIDKKPHIVCTVTVFT